MITITAYEPAFESDWDVFVKGSRNGTFILLRQYMGYHKDRFEDASIVVRDGGKILALLPAHRSGDTLFSHRGLTYGGFVINAAMTLPGMMAMFEAVIVFLRSHGFRRLSYAPVPHVYHRNPSEEDCYALFSLGATIEKRQALSVIDMSARLPRQSRRNRGAKRARAKGLVVRRSHAWRAFWRLLEDQLAERFTANPVHTSEEIEALQAKFPDNIKLFACLNETNEIEAGVVIYESEQVARTQYIASSDSGRQNGAVDLLFADLLDGEFADKPYFDFGTSNGTDGNGLARSLIEQKEGFGARTIVQDVYELMIG
jgi:hypothetical protein